MSPTPKRILILSANPKDTTQLRLDEEVREIEQGLRLAKLRDMFEIRSKWAVRLRDLRRELLEYEPQIVHFCGHGEINGIMVEDESGNSALVNSDALAGLFELFKDKVECVVLNACYSKSQAKAINRHIEFVVGMALSITDKSAIEFVVAFYDALGAGKPIDEAFRFGCNGIQLQGTSEHLVPTLHKQSSEQGGRNFHELANIDETKQVTSNMSEITLYRIKDSLKSDVEASSKDSPRILRSFERFVTRLCPIIQYGQERNDFELLDKVRNIASELLEFIPNYLGEDGEHFKNMLTILELGIHKDFSHLFAVPQINVRNLVIYPAYSCLILAIRYSDLGNYNEARRLARSLKSDAIANYVEGFCNRKMHLFLPAFQNLLTAETILDDYDKEYYSFFGLKCNSNLLRAEIYRTLGAINRELNSEEEAEVYYAKAQEAAVRAEAELQKIPNCNELPENIIRATQLRDPMWVTECVNRFETTLTKD